ncbi:MAG: hypothetical protein R3E68_14905 [Burkholderiaceae bacterium]
MCPTRPITWRRCGEAHFFVERSVGRRGEPVYRYHPLLQAYLRQLVRQAADDDEVRRQCTMLADWHELEHGEFGEAALLHAEAGQWDPFVRLLERSAGQLMASGQVAALMARLARVPQQEADRHPVIAYWQGIVWLPRDLAAGRERLLRAHRQAIAADRHELAALAMAALIESAMFDWQWRDAMPWVVELDRLCERLGHRYSSVEIEARILSCAAAAMFPAPDHPLVRRWLARARYLVLTLEAPHWRLSLARFVIGYLWWQGEPRTTRRLVTELLPIAESGAVSAAAAMELLIWCGIASSSDGNRALAARCFDQAQRLGDEQGIRFFDFHIALQRVVAAIGSSDTEGAEQAYAQLRQLAPIQGVAGRFLMELTRPGLLMHRGEIDAAMESALASMQALDDGGWVYGRATHQHASGQIAMLAGRQRLARTCFERALAFGRRMPSHFLVLMAQLMLALLDHDEGHPDSARGRLAEGLGLARRLGYRHLHPYWMPALFARVFGLALAHGIESAYVRHMIRLNPLPAPPGAATSWPYAVRLRFAGTFVIEIDGRPLAGRRKGQLKVLELIKAVAAHGHAPVPVTWLLDALWPDADGDVARDSFDVCLHRARKLLQVRDALTLEDGRLRLHPGWVWIDAASLAASIDPVPASRAGGVAPGSAQAPASAVDGRAVAGRWLTDLRGPVFDGESPPGWMLGMRESWHRRLARSALALAQACEVQGHGSDGEAVLRRWLEVYPHDQQVARALANHLVGQGRTGHAREVLAQLLETLGGRGAEPATAQLVSRLPPD